ncbi:hypothetical protein Tco_0737151 [Tanacetum coccineum]
MMLEDQTGWKLRRRKWTGTTKRLIENLESAYGRIYSEGHVDIFDMVDINLFTVVALEMMIVQLGYTGNFKSQPLFNYYRRPLTSLDEGLYALACEDDNRPPPQFRATIIEEIIDKPRSNVAIEHRSEKMLLFTWHDSSEPTTELVCDCVTPKTLTRHDSSTPRKDFICESFIARCMPLCMLTSPIGESSITYIELSGVERVDTKNHVIEDVMRQLSSEETKLDGEEGFSDVAGSGIESFGLSQDESFGVDDLNLNLNEHVGLNVSQIKTQSELHVSEEPDIGITQEPMEGVVDQACSHDLDKMQNIRVIPHNIHSDDGNPTSANINQALRKETYAPVTRTASAAVKPCQGDSFEFYLITGIVSTQGTHRTLSAPKSPKLKSMIHKLKRKLVGESSKPMKSIRFKVKHLQPAPISFIVPFITSGDYDKHQVNTTRDLVIVNVDDAIPTKQVEQMDVGEDVEADYDDHIDHTLIIIEKTGSSETRNEKKTPISTPPRSIRSNLSLHKATFMELMDNQYTISEVLRMSDLLGITKKINDALYVALQRISIDVTNDHLKDNLQKMISQDLATHVPKMIEDLFKQHMESITSNMKRNIQSQIDDFVIWGGLQDKFGTSLVSPSTCRPHASRHRDHGDYPHDNPKGGKILRSTSLALVLLDIEFIAEIQGYKSLNRLDQSLKAKGLMLSKMEISPSEENKNIAGFGFVSPQKPLDFSDLKKSLLEVEVTHESPAQLHKSPAELLQSPLELLAKDKNARKNKARKERKKRRKNRSRTTPNIDPFQKIAVNALFEILLDVVQHDDIPYDVRARERMVSHFSDGILLSKEYVNQKLLERSER